MLSEERRVDPRMKRTRQLLYDAFDGLLQEKSFQDITVQDITDRATVNRATFYAHFTDKYLLLESFIQVGFAKSLARRLPEDSALTSGNMRQLILALLDYLAQGRERYERRRTFDAQYIPLFETTLQKALHGVLSDWTAQTPCRDIAPRGACDLTATMASWAILGAGLQWAGLQWGTPPPEWGERNQSMEPMADLIVASLMHGLFCDVEIPTAEPAGPMRQLAGKVA